MERGSRRCNQTSTENCKKNPKKRQELQKIRKNLRIKIRNTTDALKKRTLEDRLKLLKKHIADKIKESRGNKLSE